MSCAVNLLPESCHNAHVRAVHRNVWTGILVSAGLLVVGTWVALRASDHALGRLGRELNGLQLKQSELDRQSTLATRIRNDLVSQGRALCALRQEHALPAQLLQLARTAPAGIVLTQISTNGSGRAGPPGGTQPNLLRPPAASTGRPQTATAATERTGRVASMRGYAVNHDELTRLIEALQHISQWNRVELLRAAREPYRASTALAFQLECRPPEIVP